MKRLLFFFFASLLPLGTWAQTTFTATNNDGYELEYTIVDGTGYGFEYACELSSITNYEIVTLTIPSVVEYNGNTYTVIGIGDYLYNNTEVESIVFPDNLIYIGEGAFLNNLQLLSVELPNTIQSIGEGAFQDCESVSSIIIAATAIAGTNELTIGEVAFISCPLTSLYLGATVSSIGESAFNDEGSGYLNKVYCMNPTPPEFVGDNHIFNGETYEGTLYVPAGSEELYASADDWSNFAEYGKIVGIGNTGDTNEITISSAGYATFYIEDAYVMPEGVTGTTVTGFNTSSSSDADYILTMPWEYEAGSTVPAKTALVLQGEANTYEYEITTSTEEAPSTNLLMGSTTETTTTGPDSSKEYLFYELSTDSDGNNVGFYWGATDGVAFTSGANKAWLPLDTSTIANARFLGFGKGDDTTGISSVESASEKAVSGIYTLQGVRVSDMNQKGVYIVDGKKVLVK